jgi:catechol-2,3-dioxygenase
MPEAPAIQLNHLNLPARDPEGLARWYAETFGLRADRHLVRGPGVLIAFVPGEPVNRAPELHLGLNVPSMTALEEWAGKFGKQIRVGPEFATFQISDPDGNCIEVYAKASG